MTINIVKNCYNLPVGPGPVPGPHRRKPIVVRVPQGGFFDRGHPAAQQFHAAFVGAKNMWVSPGPGLLPAITMALVTTNSAGRH